MTPESKNVTSSVCPSCGYAIDSATAVDGSGAQPSVGDFTICFRCRLPLRFGYDFQLERLTVPELVQFRDAILQAIRRARA